MNATKPVLYYAAPLFNPEELEKNLRVATQLATWYRVFLPQRDGVLYHKLIQQGVAIDVARSQVIGSDVPMLRICHLLVADLNGADPDYCTVGEAAYKKALGGVCRGNCVGFKTDVRGMLRTGLNPMTYAWFDEIFEGEAAEQEMFAYAEEFASKWRS